ncbi:MAG: VWA domain-containing protein, partial [Candidatus Poribacteria bacterium]|nr:VWA domain-containing protein [Candidatus Poribacteria bacterium]
MEFGRSFWWLPLFVALIAAGVAVTAYWRLRRPIPRSDRWGLIGLRLAAFALIVFALMEPTRVMTYQEPVRAQVAVLIDKSQSMSIEDAGKNRSRWEVARETADALTDRLRGRFDVREYAFDSSIHPSKPDDLQSPDGRATDALRAVRDALDNARGAPTAGVIVLSDGNQNVGRLETEASYGAPVFTIGVGNPTPPKDIAVVAVRSEPILFLGERANLNATIKVSGYPDRVLSATLTENDAIVAVKNVQTSGAESTQEVAFDFTPQKEGTFRYAVSVSPLPDEFRAENNRRSVTAQVLPSKIRVLYVDGTPRQEFAFLRRTLQRIPSVELSSVLLTTPNIDRDALPAQKGFYPIDRETATLPSSASGFAAYDVVLIGDVALSRLTPPQ